MIHNPFTTKKTITRQVEEKVGEALHLTHQTTISEKVFPHKQNKNWLHTIQHILLYLTLFLAGFMASKIHSLMTFGG